MEIQIEKVFAAIRDGDLALFRGYLDQGVDINALDANKSPLLHYALRNGKAAFVSELLSRNARIDLKSANNGESCLHEALRCSDPRNIIRALLENGANPYVVDAMGRDAFGFVKVRAGNYIVQTSSVRAVLDTVFSRDAAKFNPAPPSPPADAALTVIFNRVAGSHDMGEVYLFEIKERITYFHKPGTKALESALRQTFADIADQSGLREAYQAHLAQGGAMTEVDVFGGASFLSKFGSSVSKGPK